MGQTASQEPVTVQLPLYNERFVVERLLESAVQLDYPRELLQIQVRGTVQAPKVSAASLHTFTTTVDEVLHGSGKEK